MCIGYRIIYGSVIAVHGVRAIQYSRLILYINLPSIQPFYAYSVELPCLYTYSAKPLSPPVFVPQQQPRQRQLLLNTGQVHLDTPLTTQLTWYNVLVMTTKNEDSGSSPQTSSTPSDFTITSAMSSKTSQRVPPPEKPETIQTRFRVIAAFWAVIIFLGFPIWWKTTSVYRARLPFQEMVEWADGKVGYYQDTS